MSKRSRKSWTASVCPRVVPRCPGRLRAFRSSGLALNTARLPFGDSCAWVRFDVAYQEKFSVYRTRSSLLIPPLSLAQLHTTSHHRHFHRAGCLSYTKNLACFTYPHGPITAGRSADPAGCRSWTGTWRASTKTPTSPDAKPAIVNAVSRVRSSRGVGASFTDESQHFCLSVVTSTMRFSCSARALSTNTGSSRERNREVRGVNAAAP